MEYRNSKVELKQVILIVLKKWWLILLIMFVFGTVSKLVSDNLITQLYEAETSIFIGKEQNDTDNIGISLSDLQMSNQLIVDYKNIADPDSL